jgi:hypothetical protein
MTAASKLARTITVVGVLAVGTAVASAATAAADPPPPVPADPAAPAEPSDPGPPATAMGTVGAMLGQSTNSPAGYDLLLGQSPLPAVPGSQPVGLGDVMNTPQYLFGPNMKLSEQGQQSMYSNGPTDLNAPPPTGSIDAFQRAHGIWHEGMGRLDLGQLGQPLPGTAPPPGTNLPPGPEQFLPDPPPPPGAPPPPPGAPPPGG